jgi:gluconokinase
MNYFLGIDIGTTSTKAVAFSLTGEVITSCSSSYRMFHPQEGWSEQNPEEILNAVITSMNTVLEKLKEQKPAFVSFSAAMHSLIAVDENGKPLSACIIWADNRAFEIADALRDSETGNRIYHLTGVPVHSMSPLCKLLWWKKYEPALFSTAYKFIGIKEYVFIRLFETWVVDTSVASATGLLNLQTLQWDQEVLQYAGLESGRLSKVVPVKYTFPYKPTLKELLLPAGTPLVTGASDGALSNLGCGATGEEIMAITIGTSGAARLTVQGPVTDTSKRTFCYHLKDNQYIIGGATNNGAVVLQWLKEKLLDEKEEYDELYRLAGTVTPGSGGLIFLPYILGERAPVWNSNAKGVYFGLGIQHTKAHLVRAALEGVIYCMYSIGRILQENRNIRELRASGGFARSELWLQMLADVFNVQVCVSDSVEGSALGAVLLGAEALGLEHNIQHEIRSVHKPSNADHSLYQQAFQKFLRLYELLREEMNDF